MKKVISVLLLLALCIGCFAGCAPEVQEDAALNAAAEYLYAMYKDSKTTTDADFTVVSQVMVDGVVYPITWTADKADNVQAVAGENGTTTIKITASAEEISYKLTATLKNEQGQEASVSFDFIIPAKAQVAGKTIVLAYPKENKFITGSHYLYTGKNKWQLNLTENEAEAIALEVVENSDGTVTFKAGDQYLYCDANHVKFVTAQDDNTKFVLEAADTEGGYFIKCAVANYNGNPQYLEVYSGYLTCYGMGSDPSIYVFKLQETTTAAGTISGLEETPNPDGGNNNSGNTGNNNTGSTGGDKVDTDKTSATIYYAGEKLYITGTEYSYTSSTSGKTKIELTLSSKKADAIALTIKTNSDNTISFVAGGKYLFCDGTDVKFVSSQSDNTKFVLESAGKDQYYIKCAVANYNGNPQYLEVYKGYLTCYSLYPDSDASIYTFELKDTSGAKGKVTHVGSSSSGSTGGNTSGGNTSGGNTSGGTTNAPTNGSKVVFSFPSEGKYITGKHYEYTGSYTKMELEISDQKADAIVMEVIKNSDNTYTFKAGNQYLFCDATHVKFVAEQSDNTKFVLEDAEGGYFIKCAVATYQGKAQYLEVYKGYLTCYSKYADSDASIYTFKLDSASGANGSISGQDGSNAGGSTSGGNSGSTGGNTGSGTVDVDGKLAASIDMIGTNTRTSYSSEQTVHKANGITFTNDKAGNTNGNVDMTQYASYAYRAYSGSAVKVEYKNMVAIVFHLDDFSSGKYTKGFEGMEVAGATITCNGATVTITFASATNVFQSTNLSSQIRIKSIDVYTAN